MNDIDRDTGQPAWMSRARTSARIRVTISKPVYALLQGGPIMTETCLSCDTPVSCPNPDEYSECPKCGAQGKIVVNKVNPLDCLPECRLCDNGITDERCPDSILPDMDALHACASCGGEEVGRVLYWSYPPNSAPVCLCEDCVVLVKS